MIELKNNYCIDADKHNFILRKRDTVKKGKNAGKETISDVGFYRKMSHLLDAYSDILIKEEIERSSDLKELTKCVKAIPLELNKVMVDVEDYFK